MNINQKAAKTASLNKRNASIVKILGACIFICAVFCAGFALRGNAAFLEAMGLSSFKADTQVNPGMTVTGSTYDSVSARIAEVEGLIRQDSSDDYDLNQVSESMIGAFASSVDDPYFKYYDEEAYQAYLAGTANPSSGVGVLFTESNGSVIAADVFEDSTASAAGVQPGDVVSSIDGTAQKQWTIPEVLNALARDEGQSVYVTWRRPGSAGDTTLGTTLVYSASTEDNVTSSMRDGVGIISLSQITSDSASSVRAAIESCADQGAQAYVLDLRDVPGGYLTQAVDIASLFIASGTVVQIETSEGVTQRSADEESATSDPLVVLVNGRTSGCAEVLAAALKESDRAQLVGTVTQGKGSVQVMQPLSFGGALRYTAAYYLTSHGATIEGKGVSPSIEISNATSQMTVAYDIARSQSAQ